jgi:hypothetical protein
MEVALVRTRTSTFRKLAAANANDFIARKYEEEGH